MKKVYLIIGTRPDTIKMAPIYHALRARPELSVTLISSGQHKELMKGALKAFDLHPDIELHVMRKSKTLTELTANIMRGLAKLFKREKPDLVLTHGDTATGYAAALACFYYSIPVYHVEAGLRSHHLLSPFPEEFHRRTISMIAAHHFAPTIREKSNLLLEGTKESQITVTGTTIHEAIHSIQRQTDKDFSLIRKLGFKQIVTITMHRRENITHLRNIINSIKRIALQQNHCVFVMPLHPNPIIKQTCADILHNLNNVLLTSPLDYQKFISLLNQSDLILTDSGGIQEEAAYLGKHVFILREQIERYDGVTQGYAKMIGTHPENIEKEVINYLNQPAPPQYKNDCSTIHKASSIIADYIIRNCA